MQPWQRFAHSKCLEFDDSLWIFGGEGALDMTTGCGPVLDYLAVTQEPGVRFPTAEKMASHVVPP